VRKGPAPGGAIAARRDLPRHSQRARFPTSEDSFFGREGVASRGGRRGRAVRWPPLDRTSVPI